jgi:aldose 1-epimerase
LSIERSTIDGLPAFTLGGEGDVQATFVPAAGMIGCSLRHRGEELLGQRGGLRQYIDKRSTMGIPLLYPWANRLSSFRFELEGREVTLDLEPPARSPKLDPHGLPIHGLLAADSGWHVEKAEGDALRASLDFAAREDLLAAFPFPHLLRIEARLAGPRLTIATTVEAGAGEQVPIAFGFHPYLRLPGVERAGWEIEVPVPEQLVLDERGLPTGERVPAEVPAGRLGSRTFDDAYTAPADSRPFVLAGGGRRISLSFDSGYPYAQVYAPPDDDVIAFEPMTAPTNALVNRRDLRMLIPGERYEAVFSVEVS